MRVRETESVCVTQERNRAGGRGEARANIFKVTCEAHFRAHWPCDAVLFFSLCIAYFCLVLLTEINRGSQSPEARSHYRLVELRHTA